MTTTSRPQAGHRMSPDDDFNTSEHLRNAARQAAERNYQDFTIVDVDAHHYETESWAEIVGYLEDEVLRHFAQRGGAAEVNNTGLMTPEWGNQDLSGRLTRYPMRKKEMAGAEGAHRDAVIVRRAMDAMGIDYQIMFPTPMLNLGLHPAREVEIGLARAYARWVIEKVISADPHILTMLYLPFGNPEACLEIVREYADVPGVVGFMVTSVRFNPVHDNGYMKLYRELEERGMPLGFHAGYSWHERSMQQFNKFISVHSLGFPFYNMVHLTNWVINGLPERFPGLRVLWIEGGLAWIPFLMQRLDNEYKMRSSEAPLLRALPSDYMRKMYYTSQPMERPNDLSVLKTTFDMIDAEHQLMYSSDYPHWDFDLPSTIYDLPFLTEQAKRNILGGNACRLFGIPEHPEGDVS
ncbi:amidohydrolase family protein [Amycolatopsis jejuensis]|uniref:amidohydrolase family protein n=1 Tax=Amycolatopsis jejuensis TaxID=330084 RepID=UPI000A031BD7|nr:amidohydrolase family protein [Amycolatopsis jejuensis]